jgi:multidrug transporter EmrE-like cation transporter
MENTDVFLFLSVLVTILFVLGIKYYLKYTNFFCFVGIVLVQILAIYIYMELFKSNNSGILYAISRIIAILTILILSIVLFDEHITLKQWIGVALACAALILIMS